MDWRMDEEDNSIKSAWSVVHFAFSHSLCLSSRSSLLLFAAAAAATLLYNYLVRELESDSIFSVVVVVVDNCTLCLAQLPVQGGSGGDDGCFV